MVAREVKDLMYRFNNEGRLHKFDETVALKGYFAKKLATANTP